MQLLFTKGNWERNDLPLDDFLARIKDEGYQCSELCLNGRPDSPTEIKALHEKHGLRLIAQALTFGSTPLEHLASMESLIGKAAAAGALRINVHTGKDFFSKKDNALLFRRAHELSLQYTIPISHETHRGRALFAAFITRDFLESDLDLRLTADFSHWMTVHESNLEDQSAAVTAAIERTDHIHARVGFSQGPQVADPFAPEHAELLSQYLGFWRAIVRHAISQGKESLAITPEAGPPPYMPVLPLTRQPLADPWQINLRMMQFLRKELAV